MAARVRYLLQIIFALLISALGFFQLSERMNGKPTSGSVVMQIVCAIMFLVAWGLMSRFQKFGNQSIFACVLMLTSIGILMISRIDGEMDTARGHPPDDVAVPGARLLLRPVRLHEGLPHSFADSRM